MGFFSKLRRNKRLTKGCVQHNNAAGKVYVEHNAAGDIGQLCVSGETLAIGFVTGRRLTGSGSSKILYLFKRDKGDWITQQQFNLEDFINVPAKAKAKTDLWDFWPELEFEKDTLVFSRGYNINPETQPQRHISGEPPSNDDLDEIYILKRQGDQWVLDRTIGNSAPISGFNSSASRIYKVYALALWGDTLAALIDGQNIVSGLHIFKRVNSEWSLLQQLPLVCPQNWQEVRSNPGPSSILLNSDTLAVYTGSYNGKRELRIFGRKDRQWSLEQVISEVQPLGTLALSSHVDPDRTDYHDYHYSVRFLSLGKNRLAVKVQEQYAFEGINDVYILCRDKSDWKLEAHIAEECDPDDFNSYWRQGLEERSRQADQLSGGDKTPSGITLMADSLVESYSLTASKQGDRIAMATFDEDQKEYKLLVFKKDNADWSMEQEIPSIEIANELAFASKSSPRGTSELREVTLSDRTLIVHMAHPRSRMLDRNTTHYYNEHTVCVLTRCDKKWQLKKEFAF